MSALGLNIEDLSFRYPQAESALFKNLNLSISPGERVAIVGPSGCGKSTLFRILLGIEKAQAKKLEWSATPQGRMGLVFQEPSLLPWKTVLDNVSLPLVLQNKEVHNTYLAQYLSCY